MNKILIVFGIIFLSLGLLWFLQGSDLVHLNPILCFADCQPIVGRQPQWQITGAITFLLGLALIAFSLKRLNRH